MYALNVFVHVNLSMYSLINEESALNSEDTRVLRHIDRFVFVNFDKTANLTKTGRN